MIFNFEAQPATFIDRPNRFRVQARLHETGEVIDAHCADPGRIKELLPPGVTVYVSLAPPNSKRKTAYDLHFVEHPEHGQLVSLDTRLPNKIVWEGLQLGEFEPFQNSSEILREVQVSENLGIEVEERSRIDFWLLDQRQRPCWIEVKSVTLVENGVALFPDAPTKRGQRHLNVLTQLAQKGFRAVVLFIVQRPDANYVSPNLATDRDFAKALQAAKEAGVEIYAYTCDLTLTEVCLAEKIPVLVI